MSRRAYVSRWHQPAATAVAAEIGQGTGVHVIARRAPRGMSITSPVRIGCSSSPNVCTPSPSTITAGEQLYVEHVELVQRRELDLRGVVRGEVGDRRLLLPMNNPGEVIGK